MLDLDRLVEDCRAAVRERTPERSEWDPETQEERPHDVARARKVFADANERWRAECAGGGMA